MTKNFKKPDANWFEAMPNDRLLVEMSLWSANLGNLGADVRRVESGTDIYHLDVADGAFSPALLFFPDLVAAVRTQTTKPFHVHLMVSDAILDEQVEQFADVGADLISVHGENANAASALSRIKKRGLKTGVVLQVDTPVAAVAPLLSHVDMLTLLGTRIGVKGQGLDEKACDRLHEARALVAQKVENRRVIVAADGGIREHTVPLLRNAGAETIVMGSLAFGAADFASRIAWVHDLQRN